MMNIQDMTDLICVYDAYQAMNKSLLGDEIALGFHEGYLGAMGRVFNVIERNASEKWKKDENGVVRILDGCAISLSPEERARLLLEEDKGSIGEEEMPEKYKFQKELKEGVLIGRINNGQASVIIEGVESKAHCNAIGKISEKGIPCLVSESNRENVKYTVEAISHDNNNVKKEWICINPELFEQAVEYFLEKHQMENMIEDYDYVKKMSDAGKGRPDFKAGNTWIEIQVLRRKSSGSNQEFLASSIRQLGKHCNQFSAKKETTERMILLLVCQDKLEEIQMSFQGKANDEIKKAVVNGVEIWLAEMQIIDVDGISLLSYKDITNKILGY